MNQHCCRSLVAVHVHNYYSQLHAVWTNVCLMVYVCLMGMVLLII